MLPWSPRRCGAGEEQAPEEQDPSAGSDPCKAWPSGEGALGEPGTPAQASSPLLAEGLGGGPKGDPVSPWDPSCEAKVGPPLERGPSCGSGASFSSRTLCQPSFWPQAPATGHQNGEQTKRGADPLLPCGPRVPVHLSEDPERVTGSLKLMLPPPIMSPWVHRTPYPGCSTAWLSGPELIAVTGLLQMSQGEPRPSSLGAPVLPAGAPDPVSDHPGPSGGQSCPYCTDPSLPQTPDTHCPYFLRGQSVSFTSPNRFY